MTITELSIKRPILVIVTFLAITLIGLFAYSQLKCETFPSLTAPMVTISTTYPGASASVVEATITKIIEDAVSGVNNISDVESTSAEGASTVTVSLLNDADINIALRDIQNKVNQILSQLPEEAAQPTYSKLSIDDQPVMFIGVASNMTSKEFTTFLTNYIKPRISRLPGVAQVNFIGEAEREIRVNIDHQKLQAYGLSNSVITSVISTANLDFPTGKVKARDGQYTLRLSGKINSVEQLKSLVIKSSGNGQVLLSDVADVQDGTVERSTISRVNSSPTVGIQVYKQSDANQVEVCKSVHKVIQELEKKYPAINLKFTVIQDRSLFTLAAIKAVQEDLVIAVLLVALVMLVFLQSLRNSLIVMVAIPTSLVAALIGMWVTGCTINIFTLLAMNLVIGILIDDSIVVLENIHHQLEKGEDKHTAALKGRNEIGMAAFAITMVDLVVFLPLSMVSDIVGALIHQFSIVIVISTLVSLFVSFTVTPMLASRFSIVEKRNKKSVMGRFGLWFGARYSKMLNSYLKLLKWSLHHRGRVLLMCFLLFVLSIALVPAEFIGSEFIPSGDMGELTVEIELPSRAKIEQTDLVAKRAEKILWEIPEVEKIFTSVGSSDNGFSTTLLSNSAELTVVLVAKEKRKRSTDEVVNVIKDKLDASLDAQIHVGAASIFGFNMTPVEYVVSGAEWAKVYQGALQMKKAFAQVPGTKDIQLSIEEVRPELQVNIDRDKLSQLGLTINDVGSVLQTGFSGDTNSKFRDADGNEYDVRVVYDQFDRSSTEEVGAQSFVNSAGQVVQLDQFATLTNGYGPTELSRKNRNYIIAVSSQAIGRSSGAISEGITKVLQKTKLPEGVIWMAGDMQKNQDESFVGLGLALLAAIIFVYLVMTSLYNSFIYPLVVLFSIPLALIGSLLALGLSGSTLSTFSILGIIILVGLVSKNAILLVDFANRARAKGASVNEALLEAGKERMRPILMTTLTTICGMMPLALATSYGSEFKSGMGWVLIGGLTSSMLLTLVVVPVVYTIVEKVRESILHHKQTAPQPKLGEKIDMI
jgi:HAE1 family hydrophobic/amphiphilic exporter-1